MNAADGLLLRESEPPPYELLNPEGRSELILVCDHASKRIPVKLGNLGIDEQQLNSHIGWDPGAALVARNLSERLDAPLVLSNYSRLVIDCNRYPLTNGSIPTVSDGIEIPGNIGIDDAAMQLRRSSLFDPYHDAIDNLLALRSERRNRVLSIHSFTPMLSGVKRPWSVGVCYDADQTWAEQWLAALRSRQHEEIGDNEPYSIEQGIDYTIPVHCGVRQMSGIMLELRQDKLRSQAAVERWSELIAQCWLSSV